MMSSKLLKKHDQPNWLYRKTEPFFVWLNNKYETSLKAFLTRKWLAPTIIILSIAIIYGTMKVLPSELAPKEDRNEFRVMATAPEGASFDYMDNYVKEVNSYIDRELPEKSGLIAITSPSFGSGAVNTGFIRVILKNADERDKSQEQIVEELSGKLKQFSGARFFITETPSIGDRRSGLPVQFVVQASELDNLKKIIPEMLQKANQSPKFAYADFDLKFTKPELNVNINREKARNLGVNIVDIAQTLQLSLTGSRFGYFIMNGKQYQIIGQLEQKNRNEPLDLKTLYVKNKDGELIQLDNLVKIEESGTPPQLYRFNRYASATISGQLARGVTIGEGIEEMQNIASEVLDESYTTSLAGQSREFMESSSSIYFALVIALLIVYLVLAAQFESFKDPLVIMFTVPLAFAGALLSLWYFEQSLNIFSKIGIIMLIGLVTKNGILIVEFANQRIQAGLSLHDAIVDASSSRFRPILMTSLSTILGILPIALALGAGAESRVSMGIAVIGGLVFATVLTLFVIPSIFLMTSTSRKEPVETEEAYHSIN